METDTATATATATITNTNTVEENIIVEETNVTEPKMQITEKVKEETIEETEGETDPELEEVKIDETSKPVNTETKGITIWKKMWNTLYKFVNYYTSCSVRKQTTTNTTNEPK